MAAPVDGAWQLLIELAGDTDLTERLADALEGAELSGEPAVGMDTAAQQRLWQVREAVAEVLGVYGPPLKFDVSLPLSAIAGSPRAAELVAEHAPDAIPVLFGHIGEGNLHLNLVRCALDGDRERELYSAMMALIAALRRQRQLRTRCRHPQARLLAMSRTDADIAAMRAVKTAFDPTGYLNPAVLFELVAGDGSAARGSTRRLAPHVNACHWIGARRRPARGATAAQSRPRPGSRSERGCRSPTDSRG